MDQKVCSCCFPNNMSTVTTILIGYCTPIDQSAQCRAACSVTVVRDQDLCVLVDCGSPYDSANLLQGLNSNGYTVSDITHLLCTHAHTDHIGNLNLFPNAKIILNDVLSSPGDLYEPIDWCKPMELSPNVCIERLQGHSEYDLVLFTTDQQQKRVCVAGDLFECDNDDLLWPAASSFDVALQAKSREEILSVERSVDVIVPGHGPRFNVTTHA